MFGRPHDVPASTFRINLYMLHVKSRTTLQVYFLKNNSMYTYNRVPHQFILFLNYNVFY
jgi:hypothetical protein